MKFRTSETERVMVFIDIANIRASLRNILGEDLSKVFIDYECMVDGLVGDRKLVNAIVFDGASKESIEKLNGFHCRLRSQGFIMHVIESSISGNSQKGVDVDLAINMVSDAYRDMYDTAIIVSGDADFVPAVKMVRELGKKVEGVGCSDSTSNELRLSCSTWTDFEELICLEAKHPEQFANISEARACSDTAHDGIPEGPVESKDEGIVFDMSFMEYLGTGIIDPKMDGTLAMKEVAA